ncbi:MAG: SRPBCC family protein [Anaerolineae bacterium]
MYTFQARRTLHAPAEVVWDVISDHTLFGQVAPNLRQVVVLDGAGEGMSRQCTGSDGTNWTETCTLWQPHEAYVFEVISSDPAYPLRKMTGTFTMNELSSSVDIGMRFDYELKFNPPLLGWLMNKFAARSSIALTEAIFDGWEAAIAARTRQRAA